jgi:hypothetical protein
MSDLIVLIKRNFEKIIVVGFNQQYRDRAKSKDMQYGDRFNLFYGYFNLSLGNIEYITLQIYPHASNYFK